MAELQNKSHDLAKKLIGLLLDKINESYFNSIILFLIFISASFKRLSLIFSSFFSCALSVSDFIFL